MIKYNFYFAKIVKLIFPIIFFIFFFYLVATNFYSYQHLGLLIVFGMFFSYTALYLFFSIPIRIDIDEFGMFVIFWKKENRYLWSDVKIAFSTKFNKYFGRIDLVVKNKKFGFLGSRIIILDFNISKVRHIHSLINNKISDG